MDRHDIDRSDRGLASRGTFCRGALPAGTAARGLCDLASPRAARGVHQQGIRRRRLAARHPLGQSAARRGALPRGRCLQGARQVVPSAGQPGGLRRHRTGFVVRAGFPRPAHRQRRNLQRQCDFRRQSGPAAAELCAGHQPRQRPLTARPLQRPRPLHGRPRRRPVGEGRDAARLCRHRHGQCPGAVCGTGATQRRRYALPDGESSPSRRRSAIRTPSLPCSNRRSFGRPRRRSRARWSRLRRARCCIPPPAPA